MHCHLPGLNEILAAGGNLTRRPFCVPAATTFRECHFTPVHANMKTVTDHCRTDSKIAIAGEPSKYQSTGYSGNSFKCSLNAGCNRNIT